MKILIAVGVLLSGIANADMPRLPRYEFSKNQIDVVYDNTVFSDLETLVNSATRSIRIDFFLFSGRTADQILDTLVAKRKQGVDVKVLLDRRLLRFVTTYPERLKFVQELRQQQIPFVYSSLIPIVAGGKANTIDHNKMIIVDEKEAMIGSSNVGNWFFSYHDLMLHVTGPIAEDLAQQFDLDWYNAHHPGKEFQPPVITDAPRFNERTIDDSSMSWARVAATGIGRSNALPSLLEVLGAAQKSIDVQMHEFSDAQLIRVLIDAKNRGVKVRALLDPWEVGREFPPLKVIPNGVANVPAVDALLKAGIEVRTFHLGTEYKVAHMKSIVIDGDVLFAGSSNWTEGGFTKVIETNLEIHGGRAPGEALAMFENDWNLRSDPAQIPTKVDWDLFALYLKISGG
jgi:phosphatidylserine/phosphatidylglycerophosphate/cardiolipin synthase-like enzyme